MKTEKQVPPFALGELRMTSSLLGRNMEILLQGEKKKKEIENGYFNSSCMPHGPKHCSKYHRKELSNT